MSDRPINVLIVEDLPLAVALVRTALESEDDLATEFVNSLDDALARLSKGGVDAVLLDLGLPDANGVSAVEMLMTKHSDVPIVVLSGQAHEYAAALRAGAQEFLPKPSSGATVAHAIRVAVVRHGVRQAFAPLRDATDETWKLIGELKKVRTDLKTELGREPGSKGDKK